MTPAEPHIQLVPSDDDPLRRATPSVDDVEARRARSAIEGRLFSGRAQPVKVGRYRITGRIGSGGMGVVYRAHDPELARDVAVKVMNAESFGEDEARLARARLVREARAMARLAHPNVIHVYDVGTVEEGVFIAMELVEGRSLDQWIEQEKPDWQRVLALMVEAGRGLAAAHAAGVVHRDFKPENVLVGDDGRVRVGDFGLAGGPIAATGDLASASHSGRAQIDRLIDGHRDTRIDSASVDETLTRTGALLGTPKYMAPEAESGGPASARGDQFSFCVALFEALYGHPPFSGETVAEYRRNVRRGLIVAPPPDTKVRAWVHAEIVRGLAVDPAERHPGIDVLLEQLEQALPDPRRHARRRRRLKLGAAAVGLLAAVGLTGWTLAGRGPTPPVEAPTVDAPAIAAPATAPSQPDAEDPAPPAQATPAAASDLPSPPLPAAPLAVEPPKAESAKPPEQDPPADDDASGPAKRRRLSHCYFTEGKNLLVKRLRFRTSMVRSDGQCYDCSKKVPTHRRKGMMPDDGQGACDRYYECFKETADKCER